MAMVPVTLTWLESHTSQEFSDFNSAIKYAFPRRKLVIVALLQK